MPKPFTYTRYVLCYISDMPTRAYFFLFFCLLLPFLPTQCDKDKLTIITPTAPFHGPLPLVLSLSAPCEVSLSQLQTGSASAIPLTVNYGNLATDLTFGVYSPGGLQISAADPMLNRIQDASGGLFESCSTGSVTAKDPNPPQALSSPPVRERVNS